MLLIWVVSTGQAGRNKERGTRIQLGTWYVCDACKISKEKSLKCFCKMSLGKKSGCIRTVGVIGTRVLSEAVVMVPHRGETRQESGISSEMWQASDRSDRAYRTDNDLEQARLAAVNVQERKQSHFTIPDHISLASSCQPQPLAWLETGHFQCWKINPLDVSLPSGEGEECTELI